MVSITPWPLSEPPLDIGWMLMGRTVRTVREAIQIEESKWKPFHRQLKGKNRDRLDKMFEYVPHLCGRSLDGSSPSYAGCGIHVRAIGDYGED